MARRDDVPVGAFMRGLLIDAVPALSILFLMTLTTLPLGLPSYLRIGSLLPLAGISYWSLVRPTAMKLTLVFALGVVADCLLFTPLGVHAFIFVLTQSILKRQRRFLVGQGFWVLWVALALLIIGAWLLQWFLLSLFTMGHLPFFKSMFSAALTWALVPLLALILSMLHNIMDLFDEPAL
jgi:rod shape-determining protein MreD